MTRIDAHQHFWRLADRRGQWPGPELDALHRDFLPDDLTAHLREAGIEGTVLVQSLPSEAETRFLLELADAHPFVRGVVGWVDMKASDVVARIDHLARHPRLRGLRPMLQDLADDTWIEDAALGPAVHAMGGHALVFDALVQARQLRPLLSFARRYRALTIVIDHAAKPLIARGERRLWEDDLARLAALPNVACKLSGLLTEAGERADVATLQPYVQTVWDLFGPSRLLWGSDWPVLRLAGDYGHWLAMSEVLLSNLRTPPSTTERDAIFGANASRLYRLGRLPVDAPPTGFPSSD